MSRPYRQMERRGRATPLLCVLLVIFANAPKPSVADLIPQAETVPPQTSPPQPNPTGPVGGGSAIQFQPDLFTGAFTATYPFDLPPGRAGNTPTLMLRYNSRGDANTRLGPGWDIDLGYVELSTKHGAPQQFDCNLATNQMEYALNGAGGDLTRLPVQAGSPALLVPKIAGTDLLQFVHQGNCRFKAVDRTGNTYYFGLDPMTLSPDAGSVLLGYSSSQGVLGPQRAYLTRVDDPHGNSIHYTYFVSLGQVYPYRISYSNYHGSSPSPPVPAHLIQFIWENKPEGVASAARTEPSVLSYRNGNPVRTTLRLQGVQINTQGSLVREYRFGYTQSVDTGRGLLTTVTRCGSDGQTCMPPTQLAYSSNFGPNGTPNFPAISAGIWTEPLGIYPSGSPLSCPASLFIPLCIFPSMSVPMVEDFNADGIADFAIPRTLSQVPCPSNSSYYCSPYFDPSSSPQWSFGISTGQSFESGPSAPFIQGTSTFPGPSAYGPIFADFSGDGWTDAGWVIPRLVSGGLWNFIMYDFVVAARSRTAPSGWLDPVVWFTFPSIISTSCPVSPFDSFRVADFNGDGRTDLAFHHPISSFPNLLGGGCQYTQNPASWEVALSSGNGFNPESQWDDGTAPANVFVADANGDGKADFLAPFSGDMIVYLSTGTSFGAPTIWLNQGIPIDRQNTFIGDFNGDGKADVCIYDGSTDVTNCYPSSGYNFASYDRGPWVQDFVGNRADLLRIGDFNGDGMLDIAQFFPDYNAWNVRLSTGTSFNGAGGGLWVAASPQAAVGDFNGDGTADFVDPVFINNLYYNVFLSTPRPSDLLIRIDNGIGATTQLTYKPLRGDPQGLTDNPGITVPLTILDSITTNPGAGGRSTTTAFRYLGGSYEVPSRDFKGFATVFSQTTEGTSILATNAVGFLQEEPLRGKQFRKNICPPGSSLDACAASELGRTEVVWSVVSPLGTSVDVNVPVISQTSITREDRTVETVVVTYDTFGDPTVLASEGDALTVGDEMQTLTDYTTTQTVFPVAAFIPGGTAIPGKPSHIAVYDAYANKMREQWLEYDNLTLGSMNAGDLTRQTQWLNATPLQCRCCNSGNPATRLSYDVYGNLLQAIDAGCKTTTITYDPSQTLPVDVVNAKGQDVHIIWNLGFAKPEEIQDANGQITTYSYTPLGMVETIVGPLDSQSLPTVSYQYDFQSLPSKVITTSRTRSGGPEVETTVAFSDGLGRIIQRARTGEGGMSYYGETIAYDGLGRVMTQWLPFTVPVAFPSSYALPPAGVPHFGISYDALSRPTQVAHPDGTVESNAYSGFTTVHIDGAGKKAGTVLDAYGRVVERDEYNGGAVYRTIFSFDAVGDLVGIIDAEGNQTLARFDSLGRKTSMTDPDMGVWSYFYDEMGNLIAQRDPKAQQLTMAYDSLNRMVRKQAGSVSVGLAAQAAATTALNQASGAIASPANPAAVPAANALLSSAQQFLNDGNAYLLQGLSLSAALSFNLAQLLAGYAYDIVSTPGFPGTAMVAIVSSAGSLSPSTSIGRKTTTNVNAAGSSSNSITQHDADQALKKAEQALQRFEGTLSKAVEQNVPTNSGENLPQAFDTMLGQARAAYSAANWLFAFEIAQAVELSVDALEFVPCDGLSVQLRGLGFTSGPNANANSDPNWHPYEGSHGEALHSHQQCPAPPGGHSFDYDVTYVYDDPAVTFSNGRLTGVVDQTGTTRLAYDQVGNAIQFQKTIDGVNYVISANYDLLGRVIGLQYPDGVAVGYTYNARGLLQSVASASNTYVRNIDYNATGQALNIDLGNGVRTTNTYDPNNLRLTATTSALMPSTVLQNLSFSYDPVGNVLSRTDSYNARQSYYSYDDIYRLTSSESPGRTESFQYSIGGNLTGRVLNGAPVQFTYPVPGSSRPHAVLSGTDGSAASYDSDGNMISETLPGIGTFQYQFDEENRLNYALKNGTLVGSYSFDGLNTRVRKVDNSTGDVIRYVGNLFEHRVTSKIYVKHIYAGSQRIASELTQDPPPLAPAAPYTAKDKPAKWFSRATQGQLGPSSPRSTGCSTVRATGAESAVNWFVILLPLLIVARSRGKRWARRVRRELGMRNKAHLFYNGSPAQTLGTHFVIVCLLLSILHISGNSAPAVPNAPGVYYYFTDQVGSTTVLTDSTGVVVETLEYSPFGEVLKKSPTAGPFSTPYTYTGQEADDETGLYFYGARHYDSRIGRFVQPDPLANPMNPQSFNRYSYGMNNPINSVDPSGLSTLSDLANKTWGSVEDFWKNDIWGPTAALTQKNPQLSAALGVALQLGGGFVPYIGPLISLYGTAMLMQTSTGMAVLAIEAVIVAVTLAVVSGGATSVIIGEVIGAITGGVNGAVSAKQAGGDELLGALYGAAYGAAGGGLSGYTMFSAASAAQEIEAALAGSQTMGMGTAYTLAGAASGAAEGLAAGFEGGAGSFNHMLLQTALGAGIGATLGFLYGNAPSVRIEGFTESDVAKFPSAVRKLGIDWLTDKVELWWLQSGVVQTVTVNAGVLISRPEITLSQNRSSQ